MLKYKEGDLLKSNCTVIMHQANCFSTMGGGIAKGIAHMYPKAQIADKNYKYLPEDRLGNFTTSVQNNGVTIVNLYGQYSLGKGLQTNYRMLERSIDRFFHSVNSGLNYKVNLSRIGVPYKLGCGLAGGDWTIVSDILERQSLKHNVTIHIYKL